ncbi:serine hydrolase domain-containing protein [Nocardia sp. NPDC060256]|uniref:serine hydrolase domain-containing protein n=1 Tax=unclassified Nocardia TaxID=2637762 RepID=UPI00365CD13F
MSKSLFRRAKNRAVLLGATVVLVCAVSSCGADSRPGQQRLVTESGRAAIAQSLDAVVRTGLPGAQIVLTERGQDWTASSGVGDLATGARFPDNGYIRIGSNTKTFAATVLLQLLAEGTVVLDAPVERYLPGVVQGGGNDGTRITVRNLLQHSSGLPDTEQLLSRTPQDDLAAMRWHQFDVADVVRPVLALPSRFAPGTKAEYSNTNYLLIGMIIERVTGHSVADEIARRIVTPLGLTATYYPEPGDTALRDPHPSGYLTVDHHRIEYTAFNPSWAGASGAMIATGADLNRFFIALLTGKLLPAAQLDEMKRNTMPFDRMPGAGYGLGLIHYPVSCGKEVWGHGGSISGFHTRNGVTADGRAVTVIVNEVPESGPSEDAVLKTFDTAVCAGS